MELSIDGSTNDAGAACPCHDGQAARMGRSSFKSIVLIVEDEPLLRMAAVSMLEDAGFDTVEATNASAAVEILETRKDICLVFTDIDMPGGIDGLRLAALIRSRWPPIEVVIVSGHHDPDIGVLPDRCVFFSKPYQTDQIVSTLRQMAS